MVAANHIPPATGMPSGAVQRPPDVAELDAERQRLEQALALAERDRQLLGYEIHDGIVQDLTAAAMLLEGVGRQVEFPSPEVRENFEGGVRLLRESIAEARRLIRGLATVELDDRGLVSALERLAAKFRDDLGLPVMLRCEVRELALSASAQHLLLRITQEALYNVWKHAAASRVELRLARDERELELAVEDDGGGFDPVHIPAGHYGVAGMTERARILGARLQIDSSAGRGTRVTLRLALS